MGRAKPACSGRSCAPRHSSDRDCTLAFVKGDKVYSVANQDFGGLEEHAGYTARLTGEMNGDAIAVSKIVMPSK